MKKTAFLFLIIFLEGYIVLSAEMLAIRQTIPFVGSGTDTVSIIIAAVLMPLAVGYYAGGRFKGNVRRRLIRNLLIAGTVLTAGLSFLVLHTFFGVLLREMGWHNRLLLTTLYSVLFLVVPIYLLGQTVPLISHYFGHARLPQTTGKILFFSTVGSFIGAVFTTIVLMNTVGVSGAVICTIIGISALIILLSKRRNGMRAIVGGIILAMAALALNSGPALRHLHIVAENPYNTAQIAIQGKKRPVRYLQLNRSYASAVFEDDNSLVYKYTKYIDRYFLKTFKMANKKGRILVIGAGGFTMGLKDEWNEYVFVDIDPALQDIAEKEFLKQKILKNKTFVAQPVRSYLNQTDEKFDLVISDTGRGLTGTPEHLVTQEYFQQIRTHIKEDGVFVAHFGLSIMMQDEFSQHLDTTLRSVFPYLSRQITGGYNPWKIENNDHTSILYIGRISNGAAPGIYSDNLNTSAIDRDNKLPH